MPSESCNVDSGAYAMLAAWRCGSPGVVCGSRAREGGLRPNIASRRLRTASCLTGRMTRLELAAGAEQREAGSERVRSPKKEQQALPDRVSVIRRRLLHRTRAMRRSLSSLSSASPKPVPRPPLMWLLSESLRLYASQLYSWQIRYQIYVVSGQSQPDLEKLGKRGRKVSPGRVPSTRVLTFSCFARSREKSALRLGERAERDGEQAYTLRRRGRARPRRRLDVGQATASRRR